MSYIWNISDDYPEEMIGEYDKTVSPDRFSFQECLKLPGTIGTPTFRFRVSINRIKEWDAVENNALVPLVNERFAEILTNMAGNDIQLIGASLIATDGEISGYSIVNIIRKAACIDHAASEYSLIPGTDQIMRFRRLKHKEGCMGEWHIARDAEYKPHIVVSDAIYHVCSMDHIRGVGFTLPEELY